MTRNPAPMIAALLLLASAGWTGPVAAAAAPEDAPAAQTTNSAPSAAPPRQVQLTFADMGAGVMELRGGRPGASIDLGTRSDEVVVGAKLHLRMTYSPSLLPDLSHLRISVNGQTVAAVPLPREQAGREVEREVVLDPRYFSDYTQVRFELIGHYTLECEDPLHSSVWATIAASSDLDLVLRPLELRSDLALLPAPFFDLRDNQRLILPIVLPAQPERALIRSAGVAASWFGMLADYRSARFPVSLNELPQRHALVFATNAARPIGLSLPDVQEPTLGIVAHPTLPQVKLLVFQGKDSLQLRQAVEGLVLGNPILSGATATIARVSHQQRAPYDAPRWVRMDRAVKLGELIDAPGQLQVKGMAPDPIRVNLRLPPDLFTWNHSGVTVDLRYRYTPPLEHDASNLSVSVNDQLVRTYRLPPESQGIGGKLLIPLLQSDAAQRNDDFVIPAFQLGSNNQLQFQFAIEHHRKGLCTEVFNDTSRQSIDPDSTIDISDFAHYTAMPNLALFANAGYPFTRYADLAETGIVLPAITSEVLEQLFFLLGRMGRHTGAAAVEYQLLDPGEARKGRDLDLLLLSGPETNQLLKEWSKDLALQLDENSRSLHESAAAQAFVAEPRVIASAGRVDINSTGALGALLSFESPLTGSRTVVALTATDAATANSLVDLLDDDSAVPAIRGAVAIVRAGQVTSWQDDSIYYVGKLTWWRWLWFHLSLHPLLLTLVTLALGALIALWIYGWLQRRVVRRLQVGAS